MLRPLPGREASRAPEFTQARMVFVATPATSAAWRELSHSSVARIVLPSFLTTASAIRSARSVNSSSPISPSVFTPLTGTTPTASRWRLRDLGIVARLDVEASSTLVFAQNKDTSSPQRRRKRRRPRRDTVSREPASTPDIETKDRSLRSPSSNGVNSILERFRFEREAP